VASIEAWPVITQIKRKDRSGLGASAFSPRTESLSARIAGTEPVRSICPYCGVGCGQLIYVRDGMITDIEGDPDSPVSQGCLCPKGAATFQLVTGSHRVHSVLYRKPYGTSWEPMPLRQAMDMVAQRVKDTRAHTWDADNRRTMGFAHLGGATLDNEENYLIKKLFTALGAVQIENQARI
jgi:formate dehydrogenase major subunit